MSKKMPAFQFYPGDWMKDPNLRRCSRAAKGAWIDVLCLMFECEDRGVLSAGGVPWTNEEVAAAIGGDTSEALSCIKELESKGVAHRNQAGALFCKRMVRDEEIRHSRESAGSKGGSKTQAKRQANTQANAKQKTEDEDEDLKGGEGGTGGPPAFSAFDAFWSAWPKHFRKGDRKKCIAHWRSEGLDAFATEIAKSLSGWKRSEQWAKDGGQFIPAPLVWLNQRRWEAPPPPPGAAAAGSVTQIKINGKV